MNRLTLDEVNALDDGAFSARFADVAEHSPWVAARVASARPFVSLTALHEAMMAVIRAAGPTERVDLLRAHPDLAGRAALAGELTAASTGEQAAAGLDTLTAEEMARFQEVNRAYRERFGFPFIMAVRNADKTRILAAYGRRVAEDPDRELHTAVAEVGKIIWMRLLDRVVPAPTGRLTTHVLDTAAGVPACGVPVDLYRLSGQRVHLSSARTNADGRLDAPALAGAAFAAGIYELVFQAGVYFAAAGRDCLSPPFLDEIPLRFGIANPEAHHHVPLLLSPWAYSTYRGS